jgi:DegV family protein with EDD domain
MNFRIVVDSTFYLSEEEFAKYKIKRATLNIMDGKETYHELDLENQFIYDRLEQGHKLTTSQPAPGVFLDLYEECFTEGADKIFVLTLAEPLSGTYQSAVIARQMLDEPEKVHIFKSQMAALGNEMLCLELAKMIEANKSEEDIIKRIDHLNERSYVTFTIENLFHLMRSGRLNRAKALIGTVLRVKPILHTNQGKLELYGSARTHKKVMDEMLEYMKKTTEGAKHIYFRVTSKGSLDNARKLEQHIRDTFQNITLTFSEYIGPVFSLHLGTNAYAVAWCSEN